MIDAPASSVDVAPTILDILGIDGGQLDGASWVASARGRAMPERDIFAMVLNKRPRQYAVIRQNRKAIFSPRPRLVAVYDLVADPTESTALEVSEHQVRELTDRLAGWLAATAP